jgi:putative spermidine/putrescine transport system substrate-binding protein
VNWNNSALAYDFGVPVDGFESVWSQAQYQFIFFPDATPVDLLPRSFAQWLSYARQFPGHVTYIFPNPGDFLAARFVTQALIELAPPRFWEGPFDPAKVSAALPSGVARCRLRRLQLASLLRLLLR